MLVKAQSGSGVVQMSCMSMCMSPCAIPYLCILMMHIVLGSRSMCHCLECCRRDAAFPDTQRLHPSETKLYSYRSQCTVPVLPIAP